MPLRAYPATSAFCHLVGYAVPSVPPSLYSAPRRAPSSSRRSHLSVILSAAKLYSLRVSCRGELCSPACRRNPIQSLRAYPAIFCFVLFCHSERSEESYFFYTPSRLSPEASDFYYTVKVTKSVAGYALHPPSAESCSFGEHSLRERPSCNKADGETLAKGRTLHSITGYCPAWRGKCCPCSGVKAGCACLWRKCEAKCNDKLKFV
jgi:hypothetical protein